MLFWFVGTAVFAVWNVFHDARFDHRWLVVGVLAPDLIDGVWGGARAFHSVTASVAVLVFVMLATVGRRPIRRRLLAVPIGMFVHLVVDGAFSDTDVFWWPFTGASFDGAPMPMIDRGWINLPLELVGVVLCGWAWRKFGLADPERRRAFWREGTLST